MIPFAVTCVAVYCIGRFAILFFDQLEDSKITSGIKMVICVCGIMTIFGTDALMSSKQAEALRQIEQAQPPPVVKKTVPRTAPRR